MNTKDKTETTKGTTPATFPAGYLDALASQAQQAVYEWLKENAPAHVLAVFDGVAWLQSIADYAQDNAHISPAEIDETVLHMTERFTEEGVQTPAQHGRCGQINKRGWHQRSIHMILTRELYAGVLTFSDVRMDAPHLAIIDRATFEAAQERLKRNLQTAHRRRKRDYLLIQHLRCTCGRAMIGKAKRDPYRYYICAGQSLPKHLRNCQEPLVSAQLVEPAVWDWILRICTDEGALTSALDELAMRTAADVEPKRIELARVEREIERERRAINVWTQAYVTASSDDELEDLKGNVKQAGARLASLRRDRDRLLGEIEQGSVSHLRQRELLEGVQVWREEIQNADEETRRYMLERLHVQSRLRRDDAGLWVDVGLKLDDDPEGGYFATIDLQSAPPATPARCCDSRPAPRSRADPFA